MQLLEQEQQSGKELDGAGEVLEVDGKFWRSVGDTRGEDEKRLELEKRYLKQELQKS